MKTKTILSFTIAIAACALAILWRKPSSAPVTITVSESTGSEAPVSVQKAEPSTDAPVQHNQSRPDPSSASSSTSEEVLAQLLAEIQQAFASTILEASEFALTNLLPALVLMDAPTAARLAETITDAGLREAALRRVAQLWAAQDPSDALAWADALTDADERDARLTDVCLQVAQDNPAEAVRMRERFVTDDQPSPALEGLAQQWAEKEFTAALAWAVARPQGDQRDQLISHLAFVESQTAPIEAATLTLEKIPPGDAQNEAVISVLHQWARRDPAAATSWVERFPEGPLRDRAMLELSGIADYQRQASVP